MQATNSQLLHPRFLSLFIFFSTLLMSCSSENIQNSLEIDCDTDYEFSELTTTKDTRGNFEMKIPKTWKKEMFVNQDETRLYFADTTRQLNETFIIDIGLYFSKTIIDDAFIKNVTKEIKQNNLVQKNAITYKEKSGYAIQFFSKELNLAKNSIEIYLNNKNDSYYLLKIDAYGDQNIENRFCEALQLLNKIDFK